MEHLGKLEDWQWDAGRLRNPGPNNFDDKIHVRHLELDRTVASAGVDDAPAGLIVDHRRFEAITGAVHQPIAFGWCRKTPDDPHTRRVREHSTLATAQESVGRD